MSSDAIKEVLDALADLQLKVGVGGVRRDHILVTLLPPPADSRRREQIKHQLDDLVPEWLMRYGPVGALPPTYELTHQGWLQTKHASRVLQIIKAFLDAFRAHVTTGSTTQRLEWPDLVAQGLIDSDYHLACIVAKCFELQNGGSVQVWNGKNAPLASFGLPIDVDELIDVINPDDLVAKRRDISYARLHVRKVITGEITGHIRRAVEHIYKNFVRTGSWPLSRTLRVELAKEGIDLEKIASGRFARGYDVYTEGARTMLTLAGLLIPAEAEADRRLVVQVLRFIGDYARTHPEDRIVDALTVMERVDIDELEITAVATMLLSEGSTYVTAASDTFDVTKMIFYPSPSFTAHADAKDLWDIVLNEEEERLRWQVRSLDGVISAAAAAADESADLDEDLDRESVEHHGGRGEERHPVSDEKASREPPRFTNDEPAVTILHLSDVQFGKHHRFADEGGGFNTLLQRLCDDLDLLKRENGLAPDLVALTGDLAEWGTKREFAQAAELGKGLLRHLQLEPDRLLVVPGNHDINRKLCEAYFLRCDGDGEAPKPPYWPKWEPFVGLVNRLYRESNVERYRFTELEPWTLFEIPALKVVVAGLNSTIHESHLDADHHGFVGEAQLRWFRDKLADYERKGWLRVGLVHHNAVRRASIDDENLKDADDLREYLGELLHVLLHGHTHQGRVEMLGPLLPVISTGSAAVKRDQRPGPSPDQPGEVPNQYKLVRLTRTGLWCAAREYTYDRKRWIGDTRVSRSGDRWWDSLDRTWPRAEATFPPSASIPLGRDAAEPVRHREPWGVPADVLVRQANSMRAQAEGREAVAQQVKEVKMTRDELLARLSRLLPSQFKEVLFRAKVPPEHLPTDSAPQATRAIDAIQYLEQQNRIDQLARILEEVATGPR
jgi:3',5'-cyclic AMP phosphodiesterase CpdA